MERFNSLYETWQFCQTLIAKPKKELGAIAAEEYALLFAQYGRFIKGETYRLAKDLGFADVRNVELVCFRNKPFEGTCNRLNDIQLSFRSPFFHDFEEIKRILIHELCHTVHHNHQKEFWLLNEKCLLKMGLIGSDYDGWNKNPVMKNGRDMYETPQREIDPAEHLERTLKFDMIRRKMFYG